MYLLLCYILFYIYICTGAYDICSLSRPFGSTLGHRCQDCGQSCHRQVQRFTRKSVSALKSFESKVLPDGCVVVTIRYPLAKAGPRAKSAVYSRIERRETKRSKKIYIFYYVTMAMTHILTHDDACSLFLVSGLPLRAAASCHVRLEQEVWSQWRLPISFVNFVFPLLFPLFAPLHCSLHFRMFSFGFIGFCVCVSLFRSLCLCFCFTAGGLT